MISILAIRGAAIRLRASPFTETEIDGVHGVTYRPGVEAVPVSGADTESGEPGTYARGVHRISGLLFSYHGLAAETLLGIEDEIDLRIRYRSNDQGRVRTLKNVLFVGDATVTFPGLNRGLPELIAVPFRVQIPEGFVLSGYVEDEEEA